MASCGPTDPNEQFIQGQWRAAGNIDEAHAWYLDWVFDSGSFEVEGYPPLSQTGKYRLIESSGNTLTLELTDQEGDWPTNDRTMIIVIDTTNGTLTIDGQGPFTRGE